ncbi:MAG TPA: hypothetical protein VHW23_10075 [Kofleriaceae bacterium]|nr:hypothetical protein [Kofleriaceae bacterium]
MTAPQLALRLFAEAGEATYAAYVIPAGHAADAIEELRDELGSFPGIAVAVLRPASCAELLRELAGTTADAILIDAARFARPEWLQLDRRRSALARAAVLVFATTPDGFGELMQAAPNFASWIGALAFAYEDPARQQSELRARRLEALRAWAGKSDDDVVREAREGRLPADPEYAEWLVLLGRADLMDPQPT